jgi:hypothetical protein
MVARNQQYEKKSAFTKQREINSPAHTRRETWALHRKLHLMVQICHCSPVFVKEYTVHRLTLVATSLLAFAAKPVNNALPSSLMSSAHNRGLPSMLLSITMLEALLLGCLLAAPPIFLLPGMPLWLFLRKIYGRKEK